MRHIPQCDCAASRSAEVAMIRECYMGIGGAIDPSKEHLIEISCDHCGKRLKEFGTVTWIDPATGEPGYRTRMFTL